MGILEVWVGQRDREYEVGSELCSNLTPVDINALLMVQLVCFLVNSSLACDEC